MDLEQGQRAAALSHEVSTAQQRPGCNLGLGLARPGFWSSIWQLQKKTWARRHLPCSFTTWVAEDPCSSSVHFETQREALCGRHRLNNCLGGPHFTRTGMEKAVQIFLEP